MSTPPSVKPRTASTASVVDASTRSVAPNRTPTPASPARVHRDQPRRAGDPRALQGRQTDAAEADDRDAGARPYSGGLDRGAHARGHSAPEEAVRDNGSSAGIGITCVRCDHRVGGERAAEQDTDERFVGAGAMDPRRLGQLVPAPAGDAAQALATPAAGDRPGHDDAVAGAPPTTRRARPPPRCRLLRGRAASGTAWFPSCRARSPRGRNGTRRWPRCGRGPPRPGGSTSMGSTRGRRPARR